MTDELGPYFNSDGWFIDCIGVQPGDGSSVWNLVVQMDEDRVEKRSQVFFTPSFPDIEPVIVLDTHTWIGSFWASPKGTIFACDGLRLWTVTDGEIASQILGSADRFVERVRGFDDETVFALGESGLVLRKNGANWEDISIADAPTIMDIQLTPNGVAYACGPGGAFFRFSDGNWTRIDLGTTAEIRRLTYHNQEIYGCGASGIAFSFNNQEAQYFDALPERDFYGLAQYKEEIYFGAGGGGVDLLVGEEVISIKPNVFAQRLSASKDFLWSCGGNSIFRYSGESWLKKDFV